MSQTTGITTSPDPRRDPDRVPDLSPALLEHRHSTLWHQLRMLLTPIASLRLTVVLFALSILLVFFGTLAQMDQGIFTVLKDYFRTGIAWIPFQVFVRFGQVFLNVDPKTYVEGRFPFPGGWLLGSVLLANLVAAHLVRFKLSWKRSGILILHAGVVVMMVSEGVTGWYATEGRMTIDEGRSSSFVEDFHKFELSFIHHLDARMDDVGVLPVTVLKKKGIVRDDDLPFEVELEKYYVNSMVEDVGNAPAGAENLANKGEGLRVVAVEQKPVSGTGSSIDVPAAYVTLRSKTSGESLGTYLVSPWLPAHKRPDQPVEVDGKTYELAMRFTRTYKPYSIHLINFKFDRYKGTGIARNYSSLVRVVDPERGENREVLIRMNEPLRYRGDAFYQSDFDKRTEKTTVLQVVNNPGWLMPYISCGLVALGMLIHFGLHLYGFLRRRLAING